jgi:hypothetical protein
LGISGIKGDRMKYREKYQKELDRMEWEDNGIYDSVVAIFEEILDDLEGKVNEAKNDMEKLETLSEAKDILGNLSSDLY